MAGLVEGKVALVTGAGSGIGEAAARAFAREGARVVVSDIDDAKGNAVCEAIRDAGSEANFFLADVSDEDAVSGLVAYSVEAFGRLDCALNNAGMTGPMAPLHEMDLAQWRRTLDVNLTGVFLCMKHEIPLMQQQGAGAIVNMASGSGLIATPALAAYCASKHGVLGITKTAAVENAATGVRINAILPGSTDTPALRSSMELSPQVEKMILRSLPGGRLGKAEEIAEAAVWLCSDRASFVSGESMLVDGATVAR
ncbi:MAG: glucose 1-dehydrogenase [Deltaproteobacteria bacterium]|nr:glucose 1-dehydrogenase [Deltaproteobacteria bacterium]MBW2418803.1 glucose 1-dehydrogenase [Deltaproteobacteria bacterium]